MVIVTVTFPLDCRNVVPASASDACVCRVCPADRLKIFARCSSYSFLYLLSLDCRTERRHTHTHPSLRSHLECWHQNNLDIFLITFYRYGRSYLRVLRYYHFVVSANSREPHKLVLRRSSKDLGELSTSSLVGSVFSRWKKRGMQLPL